MGATWAKNKTQIGYDYVQSGVDNHSRLPCSEIHNDEKGTTTGGFLTRVVEFLASSGISKTEAVMTDNHWSYTESQAFTNTLGTIGARHITIRPHCPRQNDKVERFNRTLQTELAYRRIFSTNSGRTAALQPRLDHYNH